MSSIITITFSPCIDLSTSVHGLVPEKKLRCPSAKQEPGGGGINVARAIRKLGEDATAIYPVGGCVGTAFNELLDKEGVPTIPITIAHETRENFIVLDDTTDQQYRFGLPSAPLEEKDWKAILKAVSDANDVRFIVASGSLPPGVPLDIFSQLAEIAKEKNAKFIADTSGEALKNIAGKGVYLLKPNLGELSFLAGKDELNSEKVDDVAREIIKKGFCEIVVVSLGAAGAVLVTKDEIFRAVPPAIKPRSTVGAGDSMVAGLTLSLAQGKSLESTLRYGVACGSAATMNNGTELCRLQDVERLLPKIPVFEE